MSRQVEEFVPIEPGRVRLYACGFTVYDYTHLGHLRKYSMDDVLIRVLRHAGFEVKFVQNVTDVGHLSSDADTGEDKLEKGAKKYGKSVWDVAREFEEYFWQSMDQMGNLRPDVSCRATEHIKQQLEMVLELERKGFAYVIEGDGVYFDTSKLEDYGKLARLDLENLEAGSRVEVVEGKRNPTDFALWKFERPGEDRAMVWESPWSKRSFPGWHIECSAMAMHYLGNQLDIHTGGIDHIPVHHTNEIAQAEAYSGQQPFVRYWVHHNFLQVEGQKMSKSLGNFFTVDDLVARGFHPRALRLLFLTSHYRSEMNFTWESLSGAQKSYLKLLRAFSDLPEQVVDESKLSAAAIKLQQNFHAALQNDLSTPEAIAIMWEVVGSNSSSSSSSNDGLSDADKRHLLLDFDQIFQLDLARAGEILSNFDQNLPISSLPDEIQEIVRNRQAARDAKNWQLADDLREQLQSKGYTVEDKPKMQVIKLLQQ